MSGKLTKEELKAKMALKRKNMKDCRNFIGNIMSHPESAFKMLDLASTSEAQAIIQRTGIVMSKEAYNTVCIATKTSTM